MRWGRGRISGRASVEQVSRAVGPWLIIRVVEGLIAWLFFNEYFSIQSVRWLVQGAFVAYLLLNLVAVLGYRYGRGSNTLIALDIAGNMLSLGLPIAASGGHLSPLILLLPLKAIAYTLVFGPAAGAGFLGASVLMLGGMEWADRAVLISVVPLSDLV